MILNRRMAYGCTIIMIFTVFINFQYAVSFFPYYFDYKLCYFKLKYFDQRIEKNFTGEICYWRSAYFLSMNHDTKSQPDFQNGSKKKKKWSFLQKLFPNQCSTKRFKILSQKMNKLGF